MGDFTVLGWTTTLLYAVACYLSYRALNYYRACPKSETFNVLQRRGWAIVFGYMLVLGLNKQLDLQSLLAKGGTYLVLAFKVYQYNRTVEVAIFATAALLTFLSAGLALSTFLGGSRFLRMSLIGLGFVAAYVLFRAALFQRISSKGSMPLVAYLEPIGIIITSTGAYAQLSALKK